jgi:hypothetical protein
MSFEIFEHRQGRYVGAKTMREFKRIVIALKLNPGSSVLWTMPPDIAKSVAKKLEVRELLSIRTDPQHRGTIIKFKKVKS